MKLALITQDFPPRMGGIQTYSFELARRFARSLPSFVVLAPDNDGAEEVDVAAPFRVERCLGNNDVLPLTTLSKLSTLAATGVVDATFHAQWQTLPVALTLKRMGLLKRVFVAAHGRELLLAPFHRTPRLQQPYDAMRRRMLQAADAIFPVSLYTGQLLVSIGVAHDQIHVVNNGTDTEHFRPKAADELRASLGLSECAVLLSAGRLTPRKGLDMVIRCLPAIAQRVPQVRFVIVGEGDDRQRLETMARQGGVQERVVFIGKVPSEHLPDYYNMADVFITPCREQRPSVEGFGLVFLEANACGKPVIAGRSGGTSDALDDGKTGFLVTPDSQEEITERAVQLLLDPELCEQMGNAGRERAVRVGTWDHAHQTLLSVMQAVYETRTS